MEICTKWNESQRERGERINTMLQLMACEASLTEKETGRVLQYSHKEIADFCGCDTMSIKKIESNALKKLRFRSNNLK